MATCVAFLICSACTKVKPVAPSVPNAKVIVTPSILGAENLGSPLKGTNVSWLIDPLYPNLKPLITTAPNSNAGFVAVMIDNGLLNGATPINAFRFIAVNLQTQSTKIIEVTTPNGQAIQGSLGRVTRYVFGTNKKLYVSTEAGTGGGGHLIEYDPNTQTAIDLGRPFLAKGKFLEIYMLNVGKDGALYGGSFGDDGDVYTFRYAYNQSFYVDNTPINGTSKYVAYVTGDEKFTYATVGQENWMMYAINRATGQKTLMMKYNSPDDRIELTSHVDACYAKHGSTHYKLKEATTSPMDNRPLTDRVLYAPYNVEKTDLPELVWKGNEKKLYYKFTNGSEGSILINQVMEDVYPTSTMIGIKNSLFISASKVPELVSYNRNAGFKYLGNYAITAHSMAVIDNANNPKIFMGGYPKGAVLEYDLNNTWTVNNLTPTYTPPAITEVQSNPQKITQFQDADASGVRGAMYLSGMFYTKNGFLIAGGNNDRLTVSTNRELSIGSLRNGIKRNVYLPEFQNYEYSGMCLSKDSNLAYVAAKSVSGSNGKIYVYNPATNSIIESMDFPLGACPGTISIYSQNIIVGSCEGTVYLYDISKRSIIFKHDMGYSQKIYSMVTAPDGSVWITLTGTDIFNTRIVKLVIKNEPNNVTADVSLIANLSDSDRDENTKPTSMVFVEATTGKFDLYISGLKSLYRVSTCCINS
ncbi:MAG: WD40 repeat domain-containing protein [Chitinophagaceae bacterium]|nr:WD40 repeat domain-containing protein [Chitinophagaceae bacterium]